MTNEDILPIAKRLIEAGEDQATALLRAMELLAATAPPPRTYNKGHEVKVMRVLGRHLPFSVLAESLQEETALTRDQMLSAIRRLGDWVGTANNFYWLTPNGRGAAAWAVANPDAITWHKYDESSQVAQPQPQEVVAA